MLIGFYPWTGHYVNAYVGEVMILQRKLSDSDRSMVTSYLMSKWDISSSSASTSCTESSIGKSGSVFSQLQSLKPPKCMRPAGTGLFFNGTSWICECVQNSTHVYHGESCENLLVPPPPPLFPPRATYTTIDLAYENWCEYAVVYLDDRDQLFLSGGYTCATMNSYSNDRLKRAALVDLTTGESTALADMPTARGSHEVVYYDGKVYNIAGSTYHVDAGTSKVEIYDLETDVWSSGPDFPASYGGLKCVVEDATIVCAGGYQANNFKAGAFSMDLSASELKWETLPSLSDSRVSHGMASANGYVYVIAGYCAHYCYSNTVEVLDLSDPTSWLITTDANNLPDSRYSPTATSANGKIYVIGGYNPPNGEYSSYLVGEATYPSTSSWEVVDYVGPSEWDTHNYRVQRWSYYSKVTGVTVVYTKTTSSIGFFSVANV